VSVFWGFGWYPGNQISVPNDGIVGITALFNSVSQRSGVSFDRLRSLYSKYVGFEALAAQKGVSPFFA